MFRAGKHGWITLHIHDKTNPLYTEEHKKDKVGKYITNSFVKESEGTVPGVSVGPEVYKVLSHSA